jgi:hypothetical protein
MLLKTSERQMLVGGSFHGDFRVCIVAFRHYKYRDVLLHIFLMVGKVIGQKVRRVWSA